MLVEVAGAPRTVPGVTAPRDSALLRVALACPLCQDRALVQALLEHDGELLIVTELAGCRHADGFGDPTRLTLAQEWRLIEVALDAAESPDPRAATPRPKVE